MENSKQENKAAENPKPSDQVQMEIETVTPETEKDVVPTTDVKQKKDEQKDETTNEQSGPESIETVVPDRARPTASDIKQSEDGDDESLKETKEEATEEEDTDKQETDTTGDLADEDVKSTPGDENDERDQIETVSP